MRTLRFALFGNVYQARKSAMAKELLHTLEAHGAEVCIEQTFRDYLVQQALTDVGRTQTFSGRDFTADFAISMGGDGTFLQTASRVGDKNIPIIGINAGRMGFLADVGGEEIQSIIGKIYDGDYRVEERSVLQVSKQPQPQNETGDGAAFALNEVAVLKRDDSSMISIRVSVDDEYLTTYQADGLIINTPTGSTGYALSVGGPIMSPEARTLGITPVAPHSLNVRPITLCDDVEVTLTVESRNHNFLVALDGRSETCHEATRLHIRRAPHSVRVVKRPESSFFDTLRTKLMWGSDVRTEKN